MKRIYFILISILFCNSLSAEESQNSDYIKNLFTQTSKDIFNYIEIPTTYYNGLPSINIPLYNMKIPGYDLPIIMSYNASGFKPNDIRSRFGQDWSINVVYKIFREVKGRPDEFCLDVLIKDEKERGNHLLTDEFSREDMEPDIFYYSYPGGTGNFIFDRNSNSEFIAKPLPFKSIKVEVETNNPSNWRSKVIECFTIIDEYGNQYIYSQPEKSSYTSYSGLKRDCINSWLLTKIILAHSTESIDFHYHQCNDITEYKKLFMRSSTYTFGRVATLSDPNQSLYNVEEKFINEEFLLKSISHETNTIILNYSSDFKKIENINIKPENITIEFDINFYDESIPLWNKLDRILFKDSSLEKINKYEFKYNKEVLPKPNFEKADGKGFYCVDLWGYYNGATSNKDLISKEISFVDIGLPSLKRILRGSSDRKSNFKYAKAGVLNEIIFPTGGSQKFEYEPNVSTFNSVIDTIGV